ncbi:MAG TPA: hypothetical protein VNS63_24925 [Blastocatellia bacterium]|nr:hypothetical protein [Blastocatellia bacterium]
MSRNSILRFASIKRFVPFCALALVALAPAAIAGGFQLSVEAPNASSGSHSKDAALIVRTFGCHTPADAAITASAEGLVNGKRQSVNLEPAPYATGVYEIKKQWPSEGAWVVYVSGAYNGMTSSLLVELGPNGSVRPDTKIAEGQLKGRYARGERRKFTAQEIDSALQGLAGKVSQVDGTELPSSVSAPVIVSGLGAFLFLAGYAAITRRGKSRRGHKTEGSTLES